MMCTSSKKVFVFFCFLFVITLAAALFGIYTGVRFCVSPFGNTDIFSVDFDVFSGRTLMIDVFVAMLLPTFFVSGACSVLSPFAVFAFSFVNCLAIAFVYHTGNLSVIITAIACVFLAACCLILAFASALSITLTAGKAVIRLMNEFSKNRRRLFAKLSLCFVLCAVFAFFLYIYCYIIF